MAQHLATWYYLRRSFPFLLIGGAIVASPLPALAQRIPVADDTMGDERSIVSPDEVIRDVPSNRIDGGARRGANLFHSFREFNIDEGRGAYFTDPDGVANIITRVTGGSRSDILGTLGVLGDANLFLINPRGIVFGPNARLDIGGSFISSTADSFVFGDGFAFSATNPQAPPLLTVSVPIGLQYGSSPGAIQVQQSLLQVPDGQTLTLAGGTVDVDGAGLYAFGGQVELAGIAAPGEVGLTQQGQEWQLGVPEGLSRADVEIGNNAFVDVSAGGGGSIAITARNFTGTGAGTGLRAGIAADLGTVDAQAGDIDINTTEAINLDASTVENIVGGTGNAGDINVTTGSLALTNGAYFDTTLYGQGNTGNINVTASDAVSFDGAGAFGSGAYSWVNTGAIGQGGDINITTDALSLSNGANISTSTFGQGDAGNIIIAATNQISIDETGGDEFDHGIISSVEAGAIGQGGDIQITTGQLSLTNGMLVGTSTFSQGNAGNITITATDWVSVDGARNDGYPSSVNSSVTRRGVGRGGSISITTGSLSLTNGGLINASTNGQGDAGDITIVARDVVSFVDLGSDGFPSGASSAVGTTAIGEGGDIRITARSFSLSNGGAVGVSTTGQGNAGNITITVSDRTSFDGLGSNGLFSVESAVGSTAIGRGGNIWITTGSFSLTNGAQVSTNTLGRGDAGNITITASDAVSFDGIDSNGFTSGVASEVQPGAIGRAGDINITANSLSLTNGGVVTANTFGQGDAGNITITARDTVSFSGASIDQVGSGAYTAVTPGAIGQGGDISITTGSLSFTNGAGVTASTSGQGDAGNITITARDTVSFSGVGIDALGDVVGSGTYSSVESGAIGRGGNTRINADSLSLTNGAQVNAATEGQGNAGNIIFNTPRLLVAGNAQVLAETSSIGNGGSIVINAPVSVNLRRTNNLSPVLSVETSGAGQAGDITINTPRLTLAEQARITATATETAINPQGGGSITLNASHLNLAGVVGVFAETQGQAPAGTLRLNPYRNQPDLEITLTPRSQISASTSGSGNGGDLIVTAPQSITITGAGRLAVETSSSGDAGNMRFTTEQLSLDDGVNISASTSGTGQAGDIEITAEEFTLSDGAQVSTNTTSRGAAGDLSVQVGDRLFLTGQGTGLFASTAAGSSGNGGNIAIDPNLVQLAEGASIAVDSQGRGTGGNISLQADQLLLDQGSITAETASTQGGNIALDVEDLTLLRHNSLISATAGTDRAGGDGGNISIDSPFLVAYPNENSDISANAFSGRGGNVEINAQSLFGIEARTQPTPLSDITASSETGVAGVVNINTPDVDPNRGLVELPVDVTDASRLIVQSCPAGNGSNRQQNEFIVTGRGGLPPTPDEAVNPDAIQVDLVTTESESESSVSQQEPNQNQPPVHPTLSPGAPIVEAQGWQVGADGKVMLVATAPESAFNRTDLESIAPSPNALVHCR